MKVFELRKRIAEQQRAMKKMVDDAEKEDRDLSTDEAAAYDDLKAKLTALENRVSRLEADEDEEDEEDDAPEAAPAASTRSNPREIITRSLAGMGPSIHTQKHEYSVCRALTSVTRKEGARLDGLEGEFSQEIARRCGREPRGFYVPHTFGLDAAKKRNLTLSTGAGAVPLTTDASLIEYLYVRAQVIRAGARVLTDMQGAFALPRMTGTSTAQWVAEGNSPAPSNPTVDRVVFQPQTLADYVDISRKFIKQSSASAEQFVRADLARVVANGIDYAGINGPGVAPTPLGIIQDTNTPTVSLGANSAAPDYAHLVNMETKVAKANADEGKLAYMASAIGRGTLKTTPKASSGYPVFLCEDNEVNGYPLFTTNQIPDTFSQGTSTGNLSALIFGNWDDLVIALFGALDLLVDPYTGSSSGNVRIAVFQDADIHTRHPQSFSTMLFVPNQS